MATLTRYRSPLARLSSFGDFDQMRRQIRRLFEDIEAPLAPMDVFAFAPAIDVVENENELLLTAELPGLKSEDVTVEVENNMLTLKGEKKSEYEKEEARYHVWERSYGAFERTIPLPRTVKGDAIVAKFENGVLKVTLPKLAEAKGRKIPVVTK
jgi:HSP20 family protein